MKRKIISLFAALALVLTMLPSVYAQGETTAASAPDAKNSIEAQTALYLGLMEPVGGAFLPEEPLTNAQAVVSAAKVLRLNEEDATNIGLIYKDVTAQDAYAPYLMALVNQGLIWANGMGNFNPQEPADFTWFANILIKNAGYDMYRYDAAGITKGVSTREKLLRKDAAKMIYRMLKTKRLEVVGFSDGGQNYTESDKTILEKDYELYTAGGVMEQNEFSSLSSPQSTLGKKEVEIKDAGTFRISDEAMRNYLGCDTEFLYTKENNTIVAMALANDFTQTVLSLDHITYDGSQIIKEENGKEVKYRVSSQAKSLVNGVADGRLDLLESGRGTVSLLDYGSDKRIDVLKIDYYTVQKVTGKDTSAEVVRLDNGTVLEAEDLLNKSFADTAADDYVMLYAAKNSEANKAYVLTEKVSGTISSAGKDYVVIGDKQYKFANTSDRNGRKIGESVECFVTPDGKLAQVTTKGENGYIYAYLVNLGQDSGFGSQKVQIKAFCQDNTMKMYACEDNFSINGAKKDGGYTAQDLKMQLLANGTLNQLVRLYLTADETVKRIDIYQNCTQQAGGNGYNESAFSLDFFRNSKWKGSRTSYAHYAKGDMVAFIVPEGDATKAKDDQFRAGGYSAVFGVDSDVEQDIELYDADATYAASVLVVHKNATPTFKSVQEEMRVAVIDDIYEGIDENDEIKTYLSVFITGQKTEIALKDQEENLITRDFSADNVGDPTKVGVHHKDLKRGDAIEYVTNSDNEICNIALVARTGMMQNTWGYIGYEGTVQSKTVNPQWYTYIIQSRNVLGFSKAVKRVGQNLIVNAGNMTIEDEEFYRVVPLSGNFYVVNTKTDKIYVGSVNDIEPGDFILTRNLIDLPWDTVIYK